MAHGVYTLQWARTRKRSRKIDEFDRSHEHPTEQWERTINIAHSAY